MALLLKMILVPALIGGVTLASRRWGPRIGGLATALPVVAGPTLCFYAVEQGHAFAVGAAESTLIGLVGVGAFCVAYAWSATRWSWLVSLLWAYSAFGFVSLFIFRIEIGALIGFPVAVAALLLSRSLIPQSPSQTRSGPYPSWDLPLRMLAAAGLVFALTSMAQRLGAHLSGFLAPFPTATAILAGFTHAQDGPGEASRFLRGLLCGLCGFALFCAVLALSLPTRSLPYAVGAAITLQLALQGFILKSTSPARDHADVLQVPSRSVGQDV